MTHYPTHERRAFLDWIEDDCPETASIEEHYEPRQVSADELLRRFLLPSGCTDVMPKEYSAMVAEHLGYDGDTAGITYAIAASALLVERAVDQGAANSYLTLLCDTEGDDEC